MDKQSGTVKSARKTESQSLHSFPKQLETTKRWQCSQVILTLSYLILSFGSVAEGKLRNWTKKSEKSGLSPHASKVCCIKLLTGNTPKQQTSPQHKVYAYEETDVDIWQQFALVGKSANTKITEGKNWSHTVDWLFYVFFTDKKNL